MMPNSVYESTVESGKLHEALDHIEWLEKLPGVMIKLDPALKIVFLNDGWTDELGYERDHCIGRSIHDFISETGSHYLALFQSNPEQQVLELPIRHQNGNLIGFEWSIRRLERGGLLAILRSTEERNKFESLLRLSETQSKKLALVASRTNNAVIIADSKGRVEWVNDAFTRITGYLPEDIIGRKPGELLQGPSTDPKTIADMRDAITAGLGFQKEILNYHKDGSTYWIDVEVQPIRDENGRLVQFIAVEQDISARKSAEEAARASEARQIAIMDAALDCIITIDCNGRLLEFNPAAEQTFGYVRDEILGFDFAELIIADSHVGAHRAGMARYLQTNISHILRQRLRNLPAKRSDGSVFPAELTVVPMLANGEQVFTAFLRDITKEIQAEERQKKNEEELRLARDAAEAANRAKSEFLANISHEVRTPMSAVIGYADILLDPEIDSATRIQTVEAIRRNGQHLLQIINDVLDLSKIEAERLELDEVRISLWTLISESLSVARVRAREKGLSLEAVPVGALPRTIFTDPTRFRQILDNLLSNAVKFTPRGKIRLHLRLITNADKAKSLIMEVEDQGIGIHSDQVGKLFQPFSQADASATRRFGGTGLGLSISRRLARAMGGEITVESEPNIGSRFIVELPLQKTDLIDLVVGTEIIQPSEDGLSDQLIAPNIVVLGRILLAEDSTDNQRIITYYLERAGLTVDIAADGRTAVHKAQIGHYDAILMDMQMPVLDGYSATRELRIEGYHGPIIALTAHAMAGDEEKCLRAGCSGYLSKPVDPKVLIRTIVKILRGGNSVSHYGTPISNLPSAPVPDALAELFAEFRASLPEQFASIQKAFKEKDFTTVCLVAHRLRGAAGMYELPKVSRAAADLEESCRSNIESLIHQAIEALGKTIQ
jgi:PAS domain S-box-containing protein